MVAVPVGTTTLEVVVPETVHQIVVVLPAIVAVEVGTTVVVGTMTVVVGRTIVEVVQPSLWQITVEVVTGTTVVVGVMV
jgi:hypothetical protein